MRKIVFFGVEYKLRPEGCEYLKALQRNTKLSRRRYSKVKILVMLHQGHATEVIEAALGLGDNTIRRYREGYKDKAIIVFLVIPKHITQNYHHC